MDFATMMALEPHGPDTYVGIGPRYPWGGLYGGQIVAQALRAGAATVDPVYAVHSLHAYFIRRGDHEAPVRFEVDRLRDGRSFVTRQVTARQAVGAILTMSCSFQRPEDAADASAARMPEVAGPDGLESSGFSDMYERRFTGWGGAGQRAAWLRMAEPISGSAPGEEAVLHACALAYASDDLPTDAVVALHPDRPGDGQAGHDRFIAFSLDHAIWFHRPLAADGWALQTFTSDVFLSSRGLSRGHVFSADGTHVATITQEVLLRQRKPSSG